MEDSKVYSLLKFMDDELVRLGRPANHVWFDFSLPEDVRYFDGTTEHKCGEDLKNFISHTGYSEADATEIVKKCYSYEFIRGSQMSNIWLTEKGRAFLNNDKTDEEKMVIKIQEIHGNTQIGNNNVQNITIDQVVERLVHEIDTANSSQTEKQEAKWRLARFLEHPIIAPLISSGLASTLGITPAL